MSAGGGGGGGGPPQAAAAAASSLRTRPTFSNGRRSRRSRLGSLSLPLALPLPCASLGISVRQVTIAPAVRTNHSKLHFKSMSGAVRERYRDRLGATWMQARGEKLQLSAL